MRSKTEKKIYNKTMYGLKRLHEMSYISDLFIDTLRDVVSNIKNELALSDRKLEMITLEIHGLMTNVSPRARVKIIKILDEYEI
jgi:hypothetical protein